MRSRIKDIAQKAKVSTGTVDRVIHDREGVSAKTRERVKKIIGELNYEPDILASNLAQKKVYKIALLLPDYNKMNPFWKYPCMGIEKALNDNRYFNIEINKFNFEQFNKRSFALQAELLLEGSFDGVVLSPMYPDIASSFIRRCDEKEIPYVFINSNIENEMPLSYIGQDVFQSGYLAAKILSYGLNEDDQLMMITIARAKDNFDHFEKRMNGFRRFFKDKKKQNKLHYKVVNDKEDEIIALLKKGLQINRIRAIFVTNSRVYKVAKVLESIDRSDVRVLGYDLLRKNIHYLQKETIDFLISQKPEEQGYKAVMTLITNMIMKKEVPKVQHIPIDILTKENIDYYIN